MIAELMAFNAAFGVVKEFVGNGKELTDCFSSIAQMTEAKEELRLKQAKKKHSSFADDASEFAALEQIKQAEKELEEIIRYAGRAGLWEEYQSFCRDARKRRLEEKQARLALINKRWQYASIGVAVSLVGVGLYALFVIVKAIMG